MKAPASSPARSEPESSIALGAWLALFLVLGRSAVLLALELGHHGNRELAGLRLAHGFWPLLAVAGGVALAAGLGLWIATRSGSGSLSRSLRALVALALAAAAFLFLSGRLEGDPSRRIGTQTPLGSKALALTAVCALALALFFFTTRLRSLRAWLADARRGGLVPLVLLVLLATGLRVAYGGLGATMEVRRVEHELCGEKWEALRAHPEGAAAPGILCPAAEYRADGAARTTLVLPPPALVRRVLPGSDELLWLVGGAGIDHSVSTDALERYRGHSLRFRVHVNGARVFEASLPIQGSPAWVELGGGEGLELRGNSELELETVLLDARGQEVQPADPLRVGFGGLALERRERRARARASEQHPNIVLVLIDTLRADRTSAYGYERAPAGTRTTPHLEALAARGLLFEEACSTASWTWPSTASILTGLQPEEHGVQDGASSFLPRQLDTLAEALQRAGFTTAAWSGSPLIVPAKDFDQGFEFFDASREGRVRRSNVVLPGALEWLAVAREWRFFLYLHLMEPHMPYVPLPEGRALFAADVPHSFPARKPMDDSWELLQAGFSESGERRTESVVPPEEQRWIRDLYDGCVWSADHYLGQVLARLDELGLSANTIVAVTSDHGEELFDHGLLTHSSTLHRELVRVPLVLAGPGIPRAERVSTVLSNAGLGPTLARLGGSSIAGLTESAQASLDLLRPSAEGTVLFSTQQGWWNGVHRQPLFGLRKDQSVLHFAPQGTPWGKRTKDGKGEMRLYDLALDPDEQTDLASLEPARAQALLDELLLRLAGFEERRVETGGVVDEGTLDLLRELGYVGK